MIELIFIFFIGLSFLIGLKLGFYYCSRLEELKREVNEQIDKLRR